MTLEEFARGKLTEEILGDDGEVNLLKRRVALGIFSRLISRPPEGTPRDTNRANNGWDMTVGSPGGSDPGELPKGRRHTPKQAQGANVANAGVNEAIYITNNVPYIVALNNGHSQQAPTGFVENAVERELKKAGRG